MDNLISDIYKNSDNLMKDLFSNYYDNKDNILVAAANYNGYFVYKIDYDENNNTLDSLIKIVYMGPDDLDEDLGDNRIESIVLSKENDIAFILDKYENIWLHKYSDDNNTVQYDKRKILTKQ